MLGPVEIWGWGGIPGLGTLCRESENAFIFACMSELRPLGRLGSGAGRRAAFTGPRGADDEDMDGAWPSFGKRKEGGLGEASSGVAGFEVAGEEPPESISSLLSERAFEGRCEYPESIALYKFCMCAAALLSDITQRMQLRTQRRMRHHSRYDSGSSKSTRLCLAKVAKQIVVFF